ncbi:MAG: cysteine peptidase family C39 domain-containing protein, partial [Paludibacter sp.]|nr:cysteine peptidase family C39 domain-containing protein [Paludibacter sp.]
LASKLTVEELIKNRKYYPCILHWHQNHFVVLQGIRKNIFTGKHSFIINILTRYNNNRQKTPAANLRFCEMAGATCPKFCLTLQVCGSSRRQ